jgi:tRNA 5-methylaminomethyl-2-thiouridine biosynthesis bifunctional protein
VAAALARRGLAVTVLDAAPAPATGASGVPVGLAVPHVSADDNPRSRLTRHGTRLLLQQAQALLQQGRDWAPTGVLQRPVDTAMTLPKTWPAAGQDWALPAPPHGLWHPHGAWLKPAALIAAWLSQPGINFCGNARAHRLVRKGELWHVLDDKGDELASAPLMVLACGLQCAKLATSVATLRNPLPALQGTHGQVSWGFEPVSEDTLNGAPPWPAHPINGWGSWVPGVAVDGLIAKPSTHTIAPPPTTAWFAGATFTPSDQAAPTEAQGHRANLQRMQTLLPDHAQQLQQRFADASLQAWYGERCTSHDRLPLVGALVDRELHGDQAGDPPSLWVSTAMGSRGLSLAVLCAELLAAQLGGEPWPIEASLAKSLDVFRGK